MPYSTVCRVLVLLGALALTGACVSTSPTGDRGEETIKSTSARTGGGADRTGRDLNALDDRIGQFLYYDAQPGDDARARRNEAERYLRTQVGQLLDRLLTLVGDEEQPRARVIAAKALAFSRDARSVDRLSRLLDPDADPRVLTAATWSLGKIKSPTTPGEALLDLVLHENRDVRNNSLLALWHGMDGRVREGGSALDPIAHQRALTLLQTVLLEQDDAQIRGHAAACLGALRDPAAVDVLLDLLKDDHPFVRTHTALALGKIGDRRALGPLVMAIDTSPGNTPRSAVCASLEWMAERAGVPVPPQIASTSAAWGRFVREILEPALDRR